MQPDLLQSVPIYCAVALLFIASIFVIAATLSRKKNKGMTSVIAGCLMTFSVSGCGLNGPAHKPATSNVAAVIDLGFMSFTPALVTIHPGDAVEWRNMSVIPHTVTDDPSRAKKQEDAGLPAGAQIFDSGEIAAGQTYMQTFTAPGTYRYFCTYHESHGMVGTVIVAPALRVHVEFRAPE
jgi:plastocyanin